jgi:Transposase DDE domain group 1
MLMIAAGYGDGNDADSLRSDPLFKLAMDRLPERGDLCSQSTVSRTENLPDWHALLRMGTGLSLARASRRELDAEARIPKRALQRRKAPGRRSWPGGGTRCLPRGGPVELAEDRASLRWRYHVSFVNVPRDRLKPGGHAARRKGRRARPSATA